jgi:hypothetical protein
MLVGSTNIWLSITHENSYSCLRLDMNVFNIMCTCPFLELLVTKLFLFGNNVIEKNYNMTFMSKMSINFVESGGHQVKFIPFTKLYKVLNLKVSPIIFTWWAPGKIFFSS